jgi:hypothetical protein
MSLLDSWMPEYDVSARYSIPVAAPPERVYHALIRSDFSRPWLVRSLMGLRLLPGLLRSPRQTWRRWSRANPRLRASLQDLDGSDFIRLEAAPPREIVLGITGRFWTISAQITPRPAERFRDPLPAGLAQAAWNFEIGSTPEGSSLATETRIRCADPPTLRQFRRYWRVVAPGSALIRLALLRQVRQEALAGIRN